MKMQIKLQQPCRPWVAIALMAAFGSAHAVLTPEQQSRIRAAAPSTASVAPKKHRRVLIWNTPYMEQSPHKGYTIPQGAFAMKTLGAKTGAFDVRISDDQTLLLPGNIARYDAIILNNSSGPWTTPTDSSLPRFAGVSRDKQEIESPLRKSFIAGLKGGGGVAYHYATDVGTAASPAVIEEKTPQARPNDRSLIKSITKETIRSNRDGSGVTWFHPRACLLPSAQGRPSVLMTLQEIGGSDYFGPVHWSESGDLGRTWSEPRPIPPLGRDPVDGHPGLLAGVCDVTPQYHSQTGTILAMGHVVFYRGTKFSRGDQLARYPVYAVRRADGSWSPRKILMWNDPRGRFIYSNNCGQRVVMPNGDIVMSFTFGPTANNRMVAGVRCSFDGHDLAVRDVGPALENRVGRGLLEPSVTLYKGRFYLTMRAEDGHGYVAVSDDGLNYGDKKAWAWDDGTPISMSTTQQHWLTHSDGLFLVYTRKDATNLKVIRWRSPLWVARVDTQRLCLIRRSERTVLPLVGDGVKRPDDVALMGNFAVTNVAPLESWVTVGEWLPRRGARGDLLLARIRWSKPNRLLK